MKKMFALCLLICLYCIAFAQHNGVTFKSSDPAPETAFVKKAVWVQPNAVKEVRGV